MSVELPSDAELKRYVDRCRGMSEDGKYSWWSRLADILTALDRDRQLFQASHGAVRVKALEWSTGWGVVKAETTIGHYFVEDNRDGAFKVRLEDVWSTWASTSEAAKAAAQADFERRIISTLSDAVAEREAKPVDERSTAQIEFEQVVAESEGGLFGQLDRLHSELEALRKRVAELKKSEDEAYRIIGKLEAHAINDIMYDGRDVAAWCANYAARRVREGGEANG